MQRKILIVDDEPDLVEIISDILGDEGFLCYSAHSAPEARAFLADYVQKGGHIDLVISDLNMPGGSGIDLLNAVRKEGILTPFFFLTGDISESEIQPYEDQGVLGYQLKPFRSEEFIQRLKSLLGASS